MTGLAELVLSLLGLLEAEGKVFKANALEIARAILLMLIGFLFAAAALALLVCALHSALTLFLPAWASLALIALACAIIAAILLCSVKILTKKPPPGSPGPAETARTTSS